MFLVNILRCADGSYYIGDADNLERCTGQYQARECEGYAAMRRPVQLIGSQEYVTWEDALSAEIQSKARAARRKKCMMQGDWTDVSRLAKSKSAHLSTVSGRMDFFFSGRLEAGYPLYFA